jgi:hypothetical protein
MIVTLNTTAAVNQTASAANTAGTQNVAVNYARSSRRQWTSGTGANSVNLGWSHSAAIGGSPTDHNLASLTDDAGRAVALAKVRVFGFYALDTNVGSITLGGAASPWITLLTQLVLPPGALIYLECPSVAGWSVPGGASTLRVAGTSGDLYEILLAGE